VTEPNQDRLTWRQADAARADLYAIDDKVDFIKVQIARPPTPQRPRPDRSSFRVGRRGADDCRSAVAGAALML
jgi:hypothetical protein